MSQLETTLLLLLPSPPSDISSVNFQAAYAPAISRVISRISDFSKSRAFSRISLDIAISEPDIDPHSERVRFYERMQNVIGLLYRLVGHICVEQAVEIALRNDVDARILVIGRKSGENPSVGLLEGPLVDLENLAGSQRLWTHLFVVESESGESLLNSFIKLRKTFFVDSRFGSFLLERVPGGTSFTFSKSQVRKLQSPQTLLNRHYSIAVGGTFDHLHLGHKLLLTATTILLDPGIHSNSIIKRCLTIGITGDELLKNKKHAEYMQSWDERQEATCQFLLTIIVLRNSSEAVRRVQHFQDKGPNGKAIHYELHSGLTIKFVEITDPFGPTITEESITALVVSGETRSGGRAINDRRTAKGWSALETFEVDVLDQSSDGQEMDKSRDDFSSKISSTEIRRRLSKA